MNICSELCHVKPSWTYCRKKAPHAADFAFASFPTRPLGAVRRGKHFGSQDLESTCRFTCLTNMNSTGLSCWETDLRTFRSQTQGLDVLVLLLEVRVGLGFRYSKST